eukprot:5944336-Pleurochrysis_carterae.AAC.1
MRFLAHNACVSSHTHQPTPTVLLHRVRACVRDPSARVSADGSLTQLSKDARECALLPPFSYGSRFHHSEITTTLTLTLTLTPSLSVRPTSTHARMCASVDRRCCGAMVITHRQAATRKPSANASADVAQ